MASHLVDRLQKHRPLWNLLFLVGLPLVLTLDVAELDHIGENVLQCNNFPNFAIAVVSQNGKLQSIQADFVYSNVFGKQNLDKDEPATNDTLFCMGSISKHISSVFLLHMLRLARKEGHNFNDTSLLIDLDPTLDFEGSNLRDVTIEDMMSHRTGIAEVFAQLSFGYPQTITRAQLAQIVARTQRIQPNREVFHYNNHVSGLAGHFTEILGKKLKTTQSSWKSLIKEHLFVPLGVANDVQFADALSSTRGASPYFKVNGELRQADFRILETVYPAGPAGSVCMTVNAMVEWMHVLLTGLNSKGEVVVNMEDIVNTWKSRYEGSEGYGLGWFMGDYRGHHFVRHGGYIAPYSSSLTVFPSLNISIFSTTSTTDIGANVPLHSHIFDRLMGFEPAAPIVCSPKFNIPVSEPPTTPPLVLASDEYVGVYSHPVHGKVEIVDLNGTLHLLYGRYGNATIHCTVTENKCRLEFQGILWYLTESDDFKAGSPKLRDIHFWKTPGGHVFTISMPAVSEAVLVEFDWVKPKINGGVRVDIHILPLFFACFIALNIMFSRK